jgi:hypothetical protein
VGRAGAQAQPEGRVTEGTSALILESGYGDRFHGRRSCRTSSCIPTMRGLSVWASICSDGYAPGRTGLRRMNCGQFPAAVAPQLRRTNHYS